MWKQAEVDAAGARLRYRTAGDGPALVCLREVAGLTPAHELLTRRFRVIAFDPATSDLTDAPRLAAALAPALTRLGIDRFSVLGSSRASALALGLALEAPTRVQALVLESPLMPESREGPAADAALERRLAELDVPALVVVGTADETVSLEAARIHVKTMPRAHLVLVYDAGHAVGADRGEAFAEVVGDFLERHEAFIINRRSTVIHP